jgi:hypothetical protein
VGSLRGLQRFARGMRQVTVYGREVSLSIGPRVLCSD